MQSFSCFHIIKHAKHKSCNLFIQWKKKNNWIYNCHLSFVYFVLCISSVCLVYLLFLSLHFQWHYGRKKKDALISNPPFSHSLHPRLPVTDVSEKYQVKRGSSLRGVSYPLHNHLTRLSLLGCVNPQSRKISALASLLASSFHSFCFPALSAWLSLF